MLVWETIISNCYTFNKILLNTSPLSKTLIQEFKSIRHSICRQSLQVGKQDIHIIKRQQNLVYLYNFVFSFLTFSSSQIKIPTISCFSTSALTYVTPSVRNDFLLCSGTTFRLRPNPSPRDTLPYSHSQGKGIFIFLKFPQNLISVSSMALIIFTSIIILYLSILLDYTAAGQNLGTNYVAQNTLCNF